MSKNKKIRKLASDKLPFDMLTPKQQVKRAKRNTAYLQEHGFGAADHFRQVYGKGMVERFPFHISLPRTVLHADQFLDERGEMSEQALRGFMERLGVTQLQPQEPLAAAPSRVPGWRVGVGFSDARPSPYDLAPWQANILKRTMEQTKPRDEFHRRAQKAEGAAKYLYKSMRRYEAMLARAYYLIGVEIGRGTRFMVDPVPLIKDAPLMNAFKNELHRGYRDGENLSPEHHKSAPGQGYDGEDF